MSEWRPPGRVLLLGAHGLLGTALGPELRRAGLEVALPPHTALDLRDLTELRATVREMRPDLILNCAAQSRVDQAERDPDTAFAVNTVGAHNAALAALEGGLALLHVSTDYVFDGTRGEPYREYHPTGVPPNVYGQSKLHGEQLVRDTLPRHYIVRVAALFGAGRPDFVDWILAQANPASPLRIVADRFVSPTWTKPLAQRVVALVATHAYGTYHIAGSGRASWYELARAALEISGRDPDGVIPVADSELQSVARRASSTALDNHLLRSRGLGELPPWRESLAAYLSSRES